jgi:hypothetical protein
MCLPERVFILVVAESEPVHNFQAVEAFKKDVAASDDPGPIRLWDVCGDPVRAQCALRCKQHVLLAGSRKSCKANSGCCPTQWRLLCKTIACTHAWVYNNKNNYTAYRKSVWYTVFRYLFIWGGAMVRRLLLHLQTALVVGQDFTLATGSSA